MEHETLIMKKETVEISGDRKLYNYTFSEEQELGATTHVEHQETTETGNLEGSV
jgi:hypothetical protein